ncbi:uncharacterized protein TNCV_2544001 [Trichonephila clavipes]|nr:uncharacterized protein TNCV_2544001 [Trichonephila clavipes]
MDRPSRSPDHNPIEYVWDGLKKSFLRRSGIGGEREDDIEELIMGHEGELMIEELQETQRNVSPSEQEEDERGPMPTSAIKDLLKKWEAVRAMVLEWHPNQADVSRVGDRYNDMAINYFRKILKKREKQSRHLTCSSTPHKQKMKRTD